MKSIPSVAVSMMSAFAEEEMPSRDVTTTMLVPPDGGWGWVIVAVGFLVAIALDGVASCFFLFREPVSQDLKVELGAISFLSALFLGFYYFGGIVACSVGNHCGFRVVMFIGALGMSVGFASGYVLQDMSHLYLTIGVLGGVAAGFMFISACLPSGFYFDKKRSLAMGIVSSGSGIGIITVPQIAGIVMNHYGWRLTFVFFSGLCFIFVVLSILIRPLKPVVVIIKANTRNTALHSVESEERTIELLPSNLTSTRSHSSIISSRLSVHTNPQTFPTIGQIAQDADTISITVRNTEEDAGLLRVLTKNFKRSASTVTNIVIEVIEPEKRVLPWYKCGCCRSKTNILPSRPLLRTDLMYTGSITGLVEYTAKDNLEYQLNVTKVPHYLQVVGDVTAEYTTWCCKSILWGIRYLLDYTLLKKCAFLCLAVCGFTTYISFYLPFLFGRLQLEKTGKSDYAVTLISMIGLGITLGRISCGFIITKIKILNARVVTSATLLGAGMTVAVSPFISDNVFYQCICMGLYGFTVGFYAPLRSIIIVEFFGLNALTSATGMMILFQGLGSFLGAPCAEAALAYTDDVHSPYYLCAGSFVLASAALWPMRILHKWDTNSANRTQLRQICVTN